MTEQEKQYLNKRLGELYQQRVDLKVKIRKLDKEIKSIENKIQGAKENE